MTIMKTRSSSLSLLFFNLSDFALSLFFRRRSLRVSTHRFFSFSRRSQSQSSTSRSSKRDSRRIDVEKLQQINDLLSKWDWTIFKYLFLLIKHRDNHRIRYVQASFLDYVYTTFVDQRDFSRILETRRNYFLNQREWDWITKNLHKELKTLIENEFFDQFQKSSETIEWSSLTNFSVVKDAMSIYVSRWFNLIESVARDSFAIDRAQNTIDKQLIVLSILCHLLRFKKFINFQIIFSLYLYHDEVKRRVIDSMCFLSLIMFYKFVQRRLAQLIKNAQKRIKLIERLSTTILAYDNLKYAKDRRDERIDEMRIFKFIIIALMFETRDLDVVFLNRNMWASYLHSLFVVFVARSFYDKTLDNQIRSMRRFLQLIANQDNCRFKFNCII